MTTSTNEATQARDTPRPTRGLPPRLQGGRASGTVTMIGLTAAAAGTTWVAMFAWRGFTTQSPVFLGPLFMLGLLVGGVGIALRLARLPVLAVVAVQVVASSLAALAVITGSAVPSGATLADLGSRIDAAMKSSQAYAAPVPPDVAGVEPLLILGGLACLLLVDLLACSVRRVPLAGLPLLTIYTVPVSLTGEGVSWWVFAVTAAGFVLMLFLQENEHLSRWGRTLGQDAQDPSGFSVRTGDVRSSAAGIAGLATAVALLLPMLIPTLTLSLFSGGFGAGGDGDIQIINPTADLRRNLQRGADIPLVRVVTGDPTPSYLRVAVLTRLGDDEWSSGDRTVPQDNLAQGTLPALEGVSVDVPRREFSYQVEALDGFESKWLPTAQHLARIQAPGDWRYDLATMDFLSSDDDLTTAGLSYDFTKVELDLAALEMARAPAALGAVDTEFTATPSDLPPVVRELAREVTDGFTTRFQRAVALQEWFRGPEGGFTYSLEVTDGNGAGDLTSFLSEEPGGRIGYCEQFASAMAVMARTLGIPARVAVGFLTPEQTGATSYEYSAHDMHAWPELYFPGSGWVRFEPTPAGGQDAIATQTPDYTQEQLPSFALPSDGPSAAQPSEDVPTRGGDSVTDDPTADDAASDGGFTLGVVGRRVLAGLGVAALLTGLLLLPRLVRERRRTRRWREGGAPTAWAELHDTATDLGIAWRPGLSPRATGDRLVQHFGAPVVDGTPERPARGPEVAPAAATALDRIVHEVELLRFARNPGTAADHELRFDTELCVAALEGGASRNARRRAHWWPRSVFARSPRRASLGARRRASAETEADEATLARSGVVVDHVG